MKETPHKTLLDRDASAKAMAENFMPQLDMLTDMVNYASNLIPRAYKDGEKKLQDVIACYVLLKQFASMLDAVEVLARAGSVHAAFVPARAAFEASLYIEWLLASDGEKKATHYFVGSVRTYRAWAVKVLAGTPESEQFFNDMGQLGADLIAKYSSFDGDARAQIATADAIVARPEFAAANAAFAASPRTREWYKVLGKPSIRAIAKELRRLPEYEIYYSKGSEVVHSSAYKHHVTFGNGGTVGHPIRNVADAHTLLNFVLQSAMLTFMRVLAYYRPRELDRFGRKYVEDWRAAFTSIPRVKIQSRPREKT